MVRPEFVGHGVHVDTENGCHPICPDESGGCGKLVKGEDKIVYTPNGVFHENGYNKIEN